MRLSPEGKGNGPDGPLSTPVAMPARKSSTRTPLNTLLAPLNMMTPTALDMTPVAGCAAKFSDIQSKLGARWAIHQRQGARANQEDAAVACAHERAVFFGVFDGHGGAYASEYCAEHLHGHVVGSGLFESDVLAALQHGFLQTDAEILHQTASLHRGRDVGTAAVALVLTAEGLALAHCGDCRAILVKRSGAFVELTHDHEAVVAGGQEEPESGAAEASAALQIEARRVTRAGGRLDPGGYVCVGDDSLPMTRALGDLPLKVAKGCDWQTVPASEQVVTALPEVKTCARGAEDMCVVLASDGLFGGVMSSAEVAACAREQMEAATGRAAADVEKATARYLCDFAINEKNSSDNVTVIVVSLAPRLDDGATAAGDGVDAEAEDRPGLSARAPLREKVERPFRDAFLCAR